MYIALVSHTENDRINSKGRCNLLLEKDQTFSHIRDFFEIMEDSKVPVTQSLMVGGKVGSRLVQNVNDSESIPKKSEKSIHIHCEKWSGSWKSLGPASNLEAAKCYEQYRKILGRPTSCVFGHFLVNERLVGFLKSRKVKVDASYSPIAGERFSIRQPFKWNGVVEVPAVSNMDYPLNPFIYGQHMHILKEMVRNLSDRKVLLHTYFHSYDFFRFSEKKTKRNTHTERLFSDFIDFASDMGCKFVLLKDVPKLKLERCESYSQIIVPKTTVFHHRLNKLIRIARDKF